MQNMTFGQAIEVLKRGKKVARAGWNGKGMFLWLKPAAEIKTEWCRDPMLINLCEQNGGAIHALGTICMFTHDSTGRRAILTGWLASQSDMLLDDWYVVEEERWSVGLSDDEVIYMLECCIKHEDCDECPARKYCQHGYFTVQEIALSLIKRQRDRIKELVQSTGENSIAERDA